jgi:molecular chaperone DnaK (HSP70)
MAELTSEVGEKAQNHYEKFPKHVIYDILKVIGKSKSDIQMDPKWGFKLVEINEISYFELETPNGSRHLPQEIVIASSFIYTFKTRK